MDDKRRAVGDAQPAMWLAEMENQTPEMNLALRHHHTQLSLLDFVQTHTLSNTISIAIFIGILFFTTH